MLHLSEKIRTLFIIRLSYISKVLRLCSYLSWYGHKPGSAAVYTHRSGADMLGRVAKPTVREFMQLASPATALPGCVSTAARALPARYTGTHIGTLGRSVRVRCVNTSQIALATSASDKSQVTGSLQSLMLVPEGHFTYATMM